MAAPEKQGNQFYKNADLNLFDEHYNDFSFAGLNPPNSANAFDAALAAILPPGVRRPSSEAICEPNGTPLLYQGAKFSSFEALSAAVDQYSRLHGVKLFRSDSRTLRSAPNRANPIIPQLAPVELVYYSLTYSCVFAGKSFKNFGQSKQPCRFLVRVNITRDYQQLEVTKLGDPGEHNHDRNGVPVCPSAGGPVTRRRATIKPSQGGGSNHTAGGGRGGDIRDSSSVSVHLNHLMRTLHLFQQRNLFCDTSIVTKDGMLYAHSVVLAAVSPALYHALNSKPYVNRQPNMIDLSEYETKLVTLMIEFFYTGRLCMANAAMLREVCARLGVILEKDDGGLFEGEAPADVPTGDNISDLGLDDFGLGLGIEGFDLLTAEDFGGIAPDSFVLPSDFCTSPKNRSSRESRLGDIVGIPNDLSIPDVIDQVLPMPAGEKHDNQNAHEISNSVLAKSDSALNEQFLASSNVSAEHTSSNESDILITSDLPVTGVVPSRNSANDFPLSCVDSHTVSTIPTSANESELAGRVESVGVSVGVVVNERPKRERPGKQPFDTFIRSLNKQLRYPCSNCCKVFRYEPSLNTHRWSHWTTESVRSGSGGTYFCGKCGEIFKGRAALRSHSWSAHSCPLVSPHMCTVCGRSFLFRSRLWRHMTSHTGVGALKGMHICSTCDRWYNDRDFRDEHMAMHCSQYRSLCGACGKVFVSRTSLASHKRSHHLRRAASVLGQDEAKQYGCKQCAERFRTPASAVIHKRKHRKEFSVSATSDNVDFKTDQTVILSETNETISTEKTLDLVVVDKTAERIISTVFDSCETDAKVAESSKSVSNDYVVKQCNETSNSARTDDDDSVIEQCNEAPNSACADDVDSVVVEQRNEAPNSACADDDVVTMIERSSQFEICVSVDESTGEVSTAVNCDDGEVMLDQNVQISGVCRVEKQEKGICSEMTLTDQVDLNTKEDDSNSDDI